MAEQTEDSSNQHKKRQSIGSMAEQVATLLCRPIRENIEFFCFTGILNTFCALAVNTYHPRTVFVSTLFLELYLGCALLTITPKRIRPVVRGIMYTLIYGLAIADVFIATKYDTIINPTIILLLLETNKGEAWEFIQMALSSDVLLSWTIVAIMLAFAHGLYTLLRLDFWRKLSDFVLKVRACRAMVGLALAVSIIVAFPTAMRAIRL